MFCMIKVAQGQQWIIAMMSSHGSYFFGWLFNVQSYYAYNLDINAYHYHFVLFVRFKFFLLTFWIRILLYSIPSKNHIFKYFWFILNSVLSKVARTIAVFCQYNECNIRCRMFKRKISCANTSDHKLLFLWILWK